METLHSSLNVHRATESRRTKHVARCTTFALLLCLLASLPLAAQRVENVAHQKYLGLVADPVTAGKGSAFYRSDLDTLRVRASDLELWDGTIWSPISKIRGCSTVALEQPFAFWLNCREALRETFTAGETQAFQHNAALYLRVDADDGGSYSATSKNVYVPLRLALAGRTRGEHHLVRGNLFGYGIGDGLFLGGVVKCWGGDDNVAGTSQPACSFAEVNVWQGDAVFTAQVSGDPAPSATVISYTGEANEDTLGERLLVNTSQTQTAGTVTGIATGAGCGTDVTFSGAPDWTTFTPSAVGQYFKINSEDVTIGGTSTGYWYRVASVQSATVLRLETGYGQPTNPGGSCPLSTSGAYTLAQGSEIQAFNTSTNQLTIEANSYDWAASDNLQSPPSAHTNFRGLNLFLTHQFKTGTSRAISISNPGPFRWDAGMLLEGAPSGDNAFNRGLWITAKVDRGIDMSGATIASSAVQLPNDRVIRWGTGATGADITFTTSGSWFLFNRGGRFESSSAAVPAFTAKHAATPTTDFFRVLDSANAIVFDITSAQVVQIRPAFGVGFTLDATGSNVVQSAAGNNANVGLDLNSKGTSAVRVNATANSGAGGFEVYDGAATPKEVLSVTNNGATPLRFEGATDNGVYTTVAVTDPTLARTFTLPNADSVAVQPQTCAGTDKVSAVSAAGAITCSTDETSAGGDTKVAVFEAGTQVGTVGRRLDFTVASDFAITEDATNDQFDISIADNAITDAKLRDSAATSVIGRSAGTTGDPADIAASADAQFLSRHGGTLAFAAIVDADIPAAIARDSELHAQSHVIADTTGLGADHTTSGLTAGQVLRASGATTAAFASIADGDLPASISRDTESPAAGDISGSLSAGYTINAGAVASAELATANKTLSKSIAIFDPTTADTNKIQFYWPAAVTLQRIACSVDTGTVSINFDERAEATPNTFGTNALSAALVCDTDSQTTTSFSDSAHAADVPINLQITATSGTPTIVRIHIKAQVN